MFVAIDRASKFAFVQLIEGAGTMEAAQLLRDLIGAMSYHVHTRGPQLRFYPNFVRSLAGTASVVSSPWKSSAAKT